MLVSQDAAGAPGQRRYSQASDIVELVVLTADAPFLQTLREAVGASRRLWHVPSPDKVSDLLAAGGVGILMLDAQVLEAAHLRGFVENIKQLFPALVLIVAGTRESEGALASQISAGTVYRFIHKPMSPGRARLFADAAVRKFAEQAGRADHRSTAARQPPSSGEAAARGATARVIAPRAAASQAAAFPPAASEAGTAPVAPARPAGSRNLWIAGALTAVAVAVVIMAVRTAQGLHATSAAQPAPPAAADAAPPEEDREEMMARAEKALRAQIARSQQKRHAAAAGARSPGETPAAAEP